MTIQFVEGFDIYSNVSSTATGVAARWTLASGTGLSLVSGRFGGLALAASATTTRTQTRAVPTTSDISVGVAIKIGNASSVNGGRRLIEFRNATGAQCGVGINASGEIVAYRSTIGTAVLGTATGITFTDATWHYIEVECTIHNSTGVINVYKDGVQVLAVSGVDTQQQSTADITLLRLYGTDGTSALPDDFVWDDIYVTNVATRLGESRVDVLRPSADTADADWTPSGGGDNYVNVDETQVNGDTDYVAAANAGDLDIYALGDLGFSPTTIHAVQVTMCARKDDAATREIRSVVKSGSTTANGTTHAMTSSYLFFSDVHEDDPDTTNPWTASGVNAAQIGVEVVT
jgi:hypothetical protein